jgi:hypothetical protein
MSGDTQVELLNVTVDQSFKCSPACMDLLGLREFRTPLINGELLIVEVEHDRLATPLPAHLLAFWCPSGPRTGGVEICPLGVRWCVAIALRTLLNWT